MIYQRYASLAALALTSTYCGAAADWDRHEVPVKLEGQQKWELQEKLSDEFNFTTRAERKTDHFNKQWRSGFINDWTGPGKTIWAYDHSSTEDGKLNIRASRASGTDSVLAGCISSHDTVTYPVYVEVSIKVSQLPLASCVWMLSDDSTEEIDIVEAYGSKRDNQQWFAERLHLSHHVFIREPFQDYQPRDEGSWYYNGTQWPEDFHRVGVYWRDPWHLEYYVDGTLVRVTSGKEMIDPLDYTGGTGLSKPMHLIINTENQEWRTNAGHAPTDAELQDEDMNTMQVDWIRVYKPVSNSRF